MTMRRVLAAATAAVIGIGVVFASGVMAQTETTPPATPPARAGRRAARTPREYRPPVLGQLEAAKIELTADQKAKIKKLTDDMMASRKALESKPQAERSTENRKLGQKFRTDLLAVLTPAQQEQLKSARGAARQGRGARRGQPAGGTQPPAEKKPE